MELTDKLGRTYDKVCSNWKEFKTKYDEIKVSQDGIMKENYEKDKTISDLTNKLKSTNF